MNREVNDIIIETIKEGLHGQFAHRNSLDILDRLTHEEARNQTIEENFSSWEILYHIVFWQDLFLEMIRGTLSEGERLDRERIGRDPVCVSPALLS